MTTNEPAKTTDNDNQWELRVTLNDPGSHLGVSYLTIETGSKESVGEAYRISFEVWKDALKSLPSLMGLTDVSGYEVAVRTEDVRSFTLMPVPPKEFQTSEEWQHNEVAVRVTPERSDGEGIGQSATPDLPSDVKNPDVPDDFKGLSFGKL